MTTERAIRLLAGSLILTSLALYLLVGAPALLLALFVALNLAQSAFTGFCPAEKILAWLGVCKSSAQGAGADPVCGAPQERS